MTAVYPVPYLEPVVPQRLLDGPQEVPLLDAGVLHQPQGQLQLRVVRVDGPRQVERLLHRDHVLGHGNRGSAQRGHGVSPFVAFAPQRIRDRRAPRASKDIPPVTSNR
jgi:hypothetical protein